MKRIFFLDENQYKYDLSGVATEFKRVKNKLPFEVVGIADLSVLMNLKTPPIAIICFWHGMRHPNFCVESIFQSPILSGVPFILIGDALSDSNKQFLKEYQIEKYLRITKLKPDDIAQKVAAEVRAQLSVSPESKKYILVRKFFNALHRRQVDTADALFLHDLNDLISEADRIFYQSLIFKARKEFSQALSLYTDMIDSGKYKVDIRFINIIGNIEYKQKRYKNALQFFAMANRVSPYNFRRRYLVARCMDEIGQKNLALQQYQYIYEHCPDYPGIHTRLIELQFRDFEMANDTEAVHEQLRKMGTRHIIKMHKGIKRKHRNVNIQWISNIIIRELSIRANEEIKNFNHFVALKLYNQILHLVEKDDSKRIVHLQYCIARANFHIQEFEVATDIIDNLEKNYDLSVDIKGKIENLRTLIENDLSSPYKLPASKIG